MTTNGVSHLERPKPKPLETAACPGLFQKVIEEVRSGLVSSVAAEAILFPLDTVKLHQQVHGGSIPEAFRQVLRERGAGGIYSGLLGRLIQTITSNVGFFIWQTLLFQRCLQFHANGGSAARPPTQLSTVRSLVVNMLAQQFNRVLTNPIDVVANVNQADPKSGGFFHTFVKLARTGGRATLWRGLGVSLLLSLNPALMFTLVGKLSAFVNALKKVEGPLSASDMFWVSGVSKTIATLVTYPLIRAKAVVQTSGAPEGIWSMLGSIAARDGLSGLYVGVWIMSYKTVLFNSLMMALKQKIGGILRRRKEEEIVRWNSRLGEATWRQKVAVVHGAEEPWIAAARGACVIYVDGSWSGLHSAQEHFLREASSRGDHLLVGVHSDETHRNAMGTWPTEGFAARKEGIRRFPLATSILEDAPWEVGADLVRQLGITKVLSGSVTKMEDCKTPKGAAGVERDPQFMLDEEATNQAPADPYEECKRLGIYEEVPSLDRSTEYDAWAQKVRKILFSNVDASIDWRILVADGATAAWGQNPGYSDGAARS